jgi:2-iminobutanoate/2-iminopropanoate deaminase
MDRHVVTGAELPPSIGPYSHAVRAGGFLFCSGQIPLDPSTGEIVGTTAAEQTRQCLTNLGAVVAAAGATLGDATQVTIYVTDMGAFGEVNEVYATAFEADPPARVTIGVAALPKGAQVEIAAIIALPGG